MKNLVLFLLAGVLAGAPALVRADLLPGQSPAPAGDAGEFPTGGFPNDGFQDGWGGDWSGGGSGPLGQATKIVNLGIQTWNFIEKSKPVDNEQFTSANGLPSSAPRWEALENWRETVSEPQSVSFGSGSHKNELHLSFRIHYFYGGSFQGKGRYLADVKVIPDDVDVNWGYRLDAQATVSNVVNTATEADPVAGLELTVTWTSQTLLSSHHQSKTFFISGDGSLKVE